MFQLIAVMLCEISNRRFLRSRRRSNGAPKPKLQQFAKSFAATFAFASITYAAAMGLVHAYQHDWRIFIYLVGCTALAWIYFSQLNTVHAALADLSCAMCLSTFALLIVWAFLSFVLYLTLAPSSYERGIQVCVLFLSVGLSLAYYIRNVHKFPSTPDKLGYFSAVCGGQVTAVSMTV